MPCRTNSKMVRIPIGNSSLLSRRRREKSEDRGRALVPISVGTNRHHSNSPRTRSSETEQAIDVWPRSSLDLWNTRDFDRCFNEIEKDFFGYRPFNFFHTAVQRMNQMHEEMMRQFNWKPINNEIREYYGKDKNGKPVYYLDINVDGFQADELEVKTMGNSVIIKGNKKETSENGARNLSIYHCRTLPWSAKITKLKCNLNENGTLAIEVPLKSADTGDTWKRIPIETSGQSRDL